MFNAYDLFPENELPQLSPAAEQVLIDDLWDKPGQNNDDDFGDLFGSQLVLSDKDLRPPEEIRKELIEKGFCKEINDQFYYLEGRIHQYLISKGLAYRDEDGGVYKLSTEEH